MSVIKTTIMQASLKVGETVQVSITIASHRRNTRLNRSLTFCKAGEQGVLFEVGKYGWFWDGVNPQTLALSGVCSKEIGQKIPVIGTVIKSSLTIVEVKIDINGSFITASADAVKSLEQPVQK